MTQIKREKKKKKQNAKKERKKRRIDSKSYTLLSKSKKKIQADSKGIRNKKRAKETEKTNSEIKKAFREKSCNTIVVKRSERKRNTRKKSIY